jgi:GTP-binding protein EngB required for normal cell division
MEKKNIDSFEALAEHDKAAANALVGLAAKTKPFELVGNNIALFGMTSSGKSTMLNKIIGSKVAATGAGETTIEITSYQGKDFVVWDIPGRNDETTYLSMQYIALWKGLTKRLILITATIKENTNMMKLLDAIGLKYDIVVNKFDNVDEDERKQFREHINKEIRDIGLKGVEHVFFVSGKQPTMFSDWKKMVDYLLKP